MASINLDENSVKAIVQQAETARNEGNLKDAFQAYLKASNALTFLVNRDSVWKGQHYVKPNSNNNPNLELAIDCLVKAKTCLESTNKEEVILGTPSQPSWPTEIPQNVPQISLSPLHRALFKYAHAQRLAEQRLADAKAKNPDMSTQTLRRLIEDVRIQRDKATEVEDLIKFMNQYTIESFDPDLFAKQLTVMDLALLKPLMNSSLPQTMLLRAQNGRGNADLDHFVHHHKYLFAVFVDAILSSQPDLHPAPVRRGNVVIHPIATLSPAAARARMIQHLVSTSKILLTKYNNHASAGTLLSVLLSAPEIIRLRQTWSLVEPPAREFLERIRKRHAFVPLENHGSDEESIGTIWDGYLAGELLPQIVKNANRWHIIPWIQGAVLHAVEDLWSKFGTISSPIITSTTPLTPIGKKRFDLWMSATMSALGIPGETFWDNAAAHDSILAIQRRWNPSANMEARPPIVLTDTSQLIADAPLQHWLLTRVFRTRKQLWERSTLGCELVKNGVLPVPDELLKEDGETGLDYEDDVPLQRRGEDVSEQVVEEIPEVQEEEVQDDEETRAALAALERELELPDVPVDEPHGSSTPPDKEDSKDDRQPEAPQENAEEPNVDDIEVNDDELDRELERLEQQYQVQVTPPSMQVEEEDDLGTLQGEDDDKTVMTILDHQPNPSPMPLETEDVPVIPGTVHLPTERPSSAFDVMPNEENVWADSPVLPSPSQTKRTPVDTKDETEQLNDLLNDMGISTREDNQDSFGYQNSPLWQRLAMLKPTK